MGVVAAFLVAVIALSGCDGSSAHNGPSSSDSAPSSPPSSAPLSSTAPPAGVAVGTNPQTRLQVETWGYTADGLLSVVVSNVGQATVRSAHAIISAKDAYGNVVAAVSAPQGTPLGTRCCTIIGLAPGQRYGLYSDIGTRAPRVKTVSVDYTAVRTDVNNVASPVQSMKNAALHTSGKQAYVTVTVKMSAHVGPYITVQALLDDPHKKFLGVISGGFYCIGPNTQRSIRLQFFHPIPPGSSVDSVLSFPLDAATARIENLRECNAG